LASPNRSSRTTRCAINISSGADYWRTIERHHRRVSLRSRLSLTLATSALSVCAVASPASAADAYPCGNPVSLSWSTAQVRLCPLTSPLPPNGWVPVYKSPVASPKGAPPPAAAGWLHGTANQYFVCDRAFPAAPYYHPSGWRNVWWAYTKSDDGVWGWVPEVFFRGGNDDERDGGLSNAAMCPDPSASPPPPPAPPPPAPPGPPPPPGPSQPNPDPKPDQPLPPAPQPSDESCRPDLVNPAMKLDVRARAKGSSRARRTVTVGYNHGLSASGTFANPDGTPLAGAKLCVVSGDVLAGSSIQPMGTLVTDEKGRFTIDLPTTQSARVWFVHRGGSASAASSVELRVKTPLTLQPSRRRLRNREWVTFRGAIGGGGDPAGTLVEIQTRREGGWQTFGTVRADEDGHYRLRYRFKRTLGVARFKFRAFVRAQRGLPYASGGSPSVRITVRG
jgi:hypothetical protein